MMVWRTTAPYVLISGDWDNDFLIVQPGQKIRMAYDEEVIGVE